MLKLEQYLQLPSELDQVYKWLSEQRELHKGPWLVAVSGGMDSMMLLHWLKACAEIVDNRDLIAVHVNHGLRKEASLDSQFVVNKCRELGVHVVVKEVSLSSIPLSERRGTEADARRVRYDAIEEAANESSSNVVLLAHHADDQMETMLWRLTRGTSMTGIAAMRRETFRSGIHWLRPLLRMEKALIRDYVAKFQVPFVEDLTNASLDFTRNRIRHEIVPVLRQLNPKAAEAFARQADIAAEEDAWLHLQANEAVADVARFEANRVQINIPRLLRYPLPLQRRAITIILCCLSLTDWSARHIAGVLHLCQMSHPSGSFALTDAAVAWREYEQLFIGAPQKSGVHVTPMSWVLADCGIIAFPDNATLNHELPAQWQFECEPWEAAEGVRTESRYEAIIPRLDVVEVRVPEQGDRVSPLGLGGTKKLQDVFVDCKVPRQLRDTWPVFCVSGQIIWLPGLVRASAAAICGDRLGWRLRAKRLQHETKSEL